MEAGSAKADGQDGEDDKEDTQDDGELKEGLLYTSAGAEGGAAPTQQPASEATRLQ